MSTALLFAWSSPTSPEVDAEFNRWYEEVHAPQVKDAVGAEVTVTRYRFEDPAVDGQPPVPKYLAVYEISDTDVTTAHSALMAAFKGGRFDMSPTIDRSAARMEWYSPHARSASEDAPAQPISTKGL
ncbi:MAG: hypothetical protein C0482_19815 [Gordonia sp.]|nr:hypothetical protein [Gordonia sp. (in: high G+C Gram-positive bacteria)]